MNRCDMATTVQKPRDRFCYGYTIISIVVLILLFICVSVAQAGDVISIRYGNGLSTYHADKYSHNKGYSYRNKHKYYKNRYKTDRYYGSKYGFSYGSKFGRNHHSDDRYRGYIKSPYGNDGYRYKNRKYRGSSGNLGIYYRSGKGSLFYKVPLDRGYNNGSYLAWD